MIRSTWSVPGAIARATSIDDVLSWTSSQARPISTSDGIAKIAAGRRAAVERLPETRQDGRQDGGKEAALVGRPGVGPGAAGVHDVGGFSWVGKGRRVGGRPPWRV